MARQDMLATPIAEQETSATPMAEQETSATPMAETGPFESMVDVLNYALTLEHLEATFYREGLDQFDDQAFLDIGLQTSVRDYLVQVGDDEAAHVEALTQTITQGIPSRRRDTWVRPRPTTAPARRRSMGQPRPSCTVTSMPSSTKHPSCSAALATSCSWMPRPT